MKPLLRRHTAARLVALLVLAALCAGCGSERSRVGTHLQRAEDLLSEGRDKAAILELRSAAQLAPDDLEINRRVAEVSLQSGYLGDAIDFYREVVSLAPDDSEAALQLARLLLREDRESADELIAGVLEREPSNIDAHLLRSEAAVLSHDIRQAQRHLRRARTLDPDDPEVYWGLARVDEARIREIRRRPGRKIQSPQTFQAALDGYEEYLARGGERRLLALLARGRVLAGWPGHEAEANRAYQRAMKAATGKGSRSDRIQVFEAVRDFARTGREPQLEEKALEQLAAVDPENLQAWQDLAKVRGEGEEFRDWRRRSYDRMLASNPDSSRAHLLYARHLAEADGLAEGIAHLRNRMDQGLDPALALTGIANLQLAHGRPGDAANTIRELRETHPDYPAGQVLAARQHLRAGEYEEAAHLLRKLVSRSESADAQKLLARAELELGNHREALAAVDRALALTDGPSDDARQLKARILFASGDHRRAIAALRALEKRRPLSDGEGLMLAAAYYETGMAPVGYKLLTDMLERGEPSAEAALEFAAREGRNQFRRDRARRYLETVYVRDPRNIEVLRVLTTLDLDDDRGDEATARLDRAVRRSPSSAVLRLLRGRVALMLGQIGKARTDALRALEGTPAAANEGYELLALVLARLDDPGVEIRRMEQIDDAGRLPRNRRVLLARLYLNAGDEDRALAAYERALEEGSELRLLKNDLAYLLAKRGVDLDRALKLAKEAVETPGEQIGTADTLGYVYLQAGQYDAALWQFRHVTERADPPVAEYYFHLALALWNLERHDEAKTALEKALSLDPEFPQAGEARRKLDFLSQTTGAKPGTS